MGIAVSSSIMSMDNVAIMQVPCTLVFQIRIHGVNCCTCDTCTWIRNLLARHKTQTHTPFKSLMI